MIGEFSSMDNLSITYQSLHSKFAFIFISSAFIFHVMFLLILLWWKSLYRNQSIDLHSKSKNQFLYDRDLRHERLKVVFDRKKL